MSADELALPVPGARADPRQAAVLRYAVGVTIATAVALGVAWPLSYLTPVLTAVLLAPPGRPVPLKVSVGFVLTVAVACLFALIFSAALLPYPVAYTLLIGWLLAVMFYAQGAGAPPILILWLLIAMMVIPVVMLESADLAGFIAGQLVFGAAAAIVFVWLAHGLVPAPPDSPAPATPTAATTESPSTMDNVRDAATSTLVVFPIVMLFTVFQLTEQLLVLIFIALLGQQIRMGAGRQAGYAMIVANVAGGIISIVFYNLLVAVPWFPFLLLLTLLCGLLLGNLLFSEHRYAKLAGSAFTTVLLIIGSTTTSTSEAGGKVVTRVLQIIAAVLYIVIALNLVEKLGLRRRS